VDQVVSLKAFLPSAANSGPAFQELFFVATVLDAAELPRERELVISLANRHHQNQQARRF